MPNYTTLITLHYTTTATTTTLHYTTLHYNYNYTTLRYNTLDYTTLYHATVHNTTVHYITLITHTTTTTATATTFQLQRQTTTPLHYNYNYTYNYNCATPHYIQQLWWGDHCNHCRPLRKTQLQPRFGPSVGLLCHPWFTTTNLSYRLTIFETSAAALCGTIGIIPSICCPKTWST